MRERKVLVVDDSDLSRAILARAFRQKAWEVLEAKDGVEGAVLALKHRPQAVVTDLEMPTMDGTQLLRLLKSDPSTAHIPVVILTSHTEAPSRFWGLRTGADDYLAKGEDPARIVQLVEERSAVTAPAPEGEALPPEGPLDVVARLARTLDASLLQATLVNALLEQGMGSADLAMAAKKALDVVNQVVDAHILALALAEPHAVTAVVALKTPCALQTLDHFLCGLMEHLPVAPGAELVVELAENPEGPQKPLGIAETLFYPLPLREVEGVLAILPRDQRQFLATSQPLVGNVLRHLALVLDNARLTQRLRELSSLDSLTRLFNHRTILSRLEEELERAKRHTSTVSVVLCDLDYFKGINDTFGHLAGDTVLRTVAQTFRRILRISDALGRYGGEEFLAVLPETPLEPSRHTAERLRAALEGEAITLPDGRRVRVTASFGVASQEEVAAPTPDALIALADLRLYEAKRAGRNCVKP